MALSDLHFQRHILRRLAREFPTVVEISTVADLDTPEAHAALFYLAEKGLVEPGYISNRAGESREMLQARITARGPDWLQAEGDSSIGAADLASIFEPEEFRHYIRQSVDSSNLPDHSKRSAIQRLMTFDALDIRALALRLVQTIAHRPEVIVELIFKTGKSGSAR
jgi:hypothetical protein